MHMKNEELSVFCTPYLQVDLWHRAYALLYFLIDKFCI